MPVTIKVNGSSNSLVHKGSNGISTATVPDVCKTPSPGGPVPIPYPNISMSSDLAKGTTTVKADGGNMIAIKGSEFSRSTGDEAGTAGGVKSSTFIKESTWILYSFDVKMEGKNACRLTDKKFQNHENTVDLAGVIQPAVIAALGDDDAKALCDAICKAKNDPNVTDKQKAVAKELSGPGPLYSPKPGSKMFPEVSYRIPSGPGKGFLRLIKSATDRFLDAAKTQLAPASMMRALNTAGQLGSGRVVRWDFVQVANPAKEALPSNVKNYVECKFPPDDYTPNQSKAMKKMKDRNKVLTVTPADCGC